MADIAFTGCRGLNAAYERTHPGARRREVVVNGRRVKTVDVHSHCMIPGMLLLMKLRFRGKTRPWTTSSTLDTPSLSDAERVAILGETAARLLGITS
jgi:hypothetical protein